MRDATARIVVGVRAYVEQQEAGEAKKGVCELLVVGANCFIAIHKSCCARIDLLQDLFRVDWAAQSFGIIGAQYLTTFFSSPTQIPFLFPRNALKK